MRKLTKDPLLCMIRDWWWQMPLVHFWTMNWKIKCRRQPFQHFSPCNWMSWISDIYGVSYGASRPINGWSNRPLWLSSCIPPIVFCPPLSMSIPPPPPAISLPADLIHIRQVEVICRRFSFQSDIHKFQRQRNVLMPGFIICASLTQPYPPSICLCHFISNCFWFDFFTS